MGWYLRKSFKFGPGRLTLSKSGISYSVGVKGARLTSGPRGTHVTFGTHGIYYRTRILSQKREQRKYEPPPVQRDETLRHTITSAAIENITDTDSKAFVDELNAKARRISYLRWFCITPLLISSILYLCYFAQEASKEERTDYFAIAQGTENINIRVKPDKNSHILGTAINGQKFPVIDTLDASWNKITFGDSSGYISKHFSSLDSSRTVLRTFSRFETERKDALSLAAIGSLFYIHRHHLL